MRLVRQFFFSFFDFMVLCTGGGWAEKKILEEGDGGRIFLSRVWQFFF